MGLGRGANQPMSQVSETLIGIAGSHGVVMAPAVVISRNKTRFRLKRVPDGGQASQWQRFLDSVLAVQGELETKLAGLEVRGIESSILEAYLLMVGDETLAKAVQEEVYQRRRCADWAVAEATKRLAGRLSGVDDLYMRERSHDIEFVGDLIIRALGGVDNIAKALQITEPAIVVAHDLSPADTAGMVGAPVLGFVTEVGSRTSHTSIMARALGIPAVVGVKDALGRIGTGDNLVVDGLRGRVIVEPTEEEVEDAERRAGRYLAMAKQLGASRDAPAQTADGLRIRLVANIELPEEATMARDHGAEGVGLYRTEFLYVNQQDPPTEDRQLAIFRRVLETMDGRPVTLRTFDIGGDKFATTFRLPEELNPMLGLRAVRLALAERDVFMAHLRAMVRASAYGLVRIMIPLVSSLDELRVVRELLDRAKMEVVAAGHSVADDIPLGVMVEVPAAAIMADVFARHADFLSIGTNDLVQYCLAIDRSNRALAYLASPFDPAILRLIAGVVRAGRGEQCPVSVCGEMASEPLGALMLLGLGVRELSMEAVALPEIKEAVRRVQLREVEALAEKALQMSTAVQVEQMLEAALAGRLQDILTGQPELVPGSGRNPRSHTPAFGMPRVSGDQLISLPASPSPADGDDDEG